MFSQLECKKDTLETNLLSPPLIFRALTLMKSKLKGAVRGHSLLKKNSDALTLKFRALLGKLADVRSR
jgi:hypothetical protein